MKPFFILLLSYATLLPSLAGSPLLTPNKPIELTGTHGRFDFIKIDATRRRLLACHTGNASLDVIDLDSGKLLASVPTGNAQGVAIDDKGGRYFVSCSKPPQLAIVDAAKLAITGTVALPAPADLCAYNPIYDCLVVDNDEKPEQWWIDPKAMKISSDIVGTDSGLEDLAFRGNGLRLVQNHKDSSTIEMVGVPPSNGIGSGKYSTLPAEKPHGLAVVDARRVLIAGGNGKLALFDFRTGKVAASCDIAPKVDEIAYDPGRGRVYCASGTGVISIAVFDKNTLIAKGNIPSAKGCHSIAVDPKTHTVWIAFVQGTTPCVQSFTAK